MWSKVWGEIPEISDRLIFLLKEKSFPRCAYVYIHNTLRESEADWYGEH